MAKALEEGIRFIERMSPVEALPDENGAVKALRFERMMTKDGKLRGSGELFELPARTVCVAAGTSPNVTYEKEYPGTFELDENREYFKGHELGGATAGGLRAGAGAAGRGPRREGRLLHLVPEGRAASSPSTATTTRPTRATW